MKAPTITRHYREVVATAYGPKACWNRYEKSIGSNRMAPRWSTQGERCQSSRRASRRTRSCARLMIRFRLPTRIVGANDVDGNAHRRLGNELCIAS